MGEQGFASHDSSTWKAWSELAITHTSNSNRVSRVDTELAQIYEIPGFLSEPECNRIIAAINANLRSSNATGFEGARTSRTCDLWRFEPGLNQELDCKIAKMMGVDRRYSEPIQGQRYDQGEFFKAHTDFFSPIFADVFERHTAVGGQRTWTVMIYLNDVQEGGQTIFHRLGKCYQPKAGLALAWNNLYVDGRLNRDTLHESLPVLGGTKWVITKWFRADQGRNRV